VCDTGFSPGRVVRQLLLRTGLLDLLEVQAFSDEVGVPKPDPRIFEHALGALDATPASALHVGDLRRTDIAGARRIGMRTVRIRDHFDDPSEHAEADHVADSHAHLRELLAGMARGPGA
jgi:FMN phosphatase YigB (HAD superfamily)